MGLARFQTTLTTPFCYTVGANDHPLGEEDVSISLLDFSYSERCPGKYCPNNSGNNPLPPGIVVPLE